MSCVSVGTNNQESMLMQNRTIFRLTRALTKLLSAGLLLSLATFTATAADSALQVALNTSKAAPRVMEPLTERSILRDFTFAWESMTRALASNTTGPLNGIFDGNARAFLNDTIHGQQKSGLTSHYGNQSHKVDAVFYSPEGDLLELHDTAEYDLEIHDGSKTIDSQHVIAHYVVLMTPGADRWVVRQLQAVPQF